MKTELEALHMIGRLNNTHPQPGMEQGQIDATITALGWVLGWVDTEEMVYELTVDTAHDEG
jgi:hypothetical protein